MKTATNMAAQGDVLFRRVDAIPEGAIEEPRTGPLVVAPSETGHHHAIHAPDVALYRTGDPLLSFLRLDGHFADIEHMRPFDTHETLRLRGREDGPTFFEVRRQREHFPRPESARQWRPVQDQQAIELR